MTHDDMFTSAAAITAALLSKHEGDLLSSVDKVSPLFQLVLNQLENALQSYSGHLDAGSLETHLRALKEQISL